MDSGNNPHRGGAPKYAPSPSIDLPARQWPGRQLEKAPAWCSVDLRDGNQALPNPMTVDQKLDYFDMLCRIGFKEIEVGFGSASAEDFNAFRKLIEEERVPDDVFIMSLVQCRAALIERTFESIAGAKRAIVHAYCATSELHMKQVFGLDRAGTQKMVVDAVKLIRAGAEAAEPADIRFEFSPEEFTDTELPWALELCEAVFEAWGRASAEKPLILNLPATVERRPPNQYADMIEWFCGRFSHRDAVKISLHAHNDQGMAVAATELALMAGGDRVEGTLFGHGERTGNVDLVTLVNNLRSRGIDPGLDFGALPEIIETVERLTGMPVYYRQPYAGKYAFTAFSGSHQDAIRKGIMKQEDSKALFGVGWKVPYLHVDPADFGRQFESLVRINSQSGKGGAAFILEHDHGIEAPKAMHPEIGKAVQQYADEVRREISSDEVLQIFQKEFVNPDGPYELIGYWPRPDDDVPRKIHGQIRIRIRGEECTTHADGNGPISAFVHGMHALGAPAFSVDDYHEQAVGKGAEAMAMAYVPLRLADGRVLYGVGEDTNIDQAAVRAIVAALNRIERP